MTLEHLLATLPILIHEPRRRCDDIEGQPHEQEVTEALTEHSAKGTHIIVGDIPTDPTLFNNPISLHHLAKNHGIRYIRIIHSTNTNHSVYPVSVVHHVYDKNKDTVFIHAISRPRDSSRLINLMCKSREPGDHTIDNTMFRGTPHPAEKKWGQHIMTIMQPGNYTNGYYIGESRWIQYLKPFSDIPNDFANIATQKTKTT